MTSHMISYTNRRHISAFAKKLQFGILSILTTVFDLQICWGYREKVAADGSKFEIYEIIYSSITSIRRLWWYRLSPCPDKIYCFFLLTLSTCGVWEAVYILDGLLKKLFDIQPDAARRYSRSIWTCVAISYLLGIKLIPRIRNWKGFTLLFADCRCYL